MAESVGQSKIAEKYRKVADELWALLFSLANQSLNLNQKITSVLPIARTPADPKTKLQHVSSASSNFNSRVARSEAKLAVC